MKNKIIALILIVILSVSGSVPTVAEDCHNGTPSGTPSTSLFFTDEYSVEDGERASYFSGESLTLVSNLTGRIAISLSVTATSTMKKLGFTTLSLQHWNGSSWDDVWTETDQYSLNTDIFSFNHTVSGLTSNDYYRVSAELYAKKGFLQTQRKTIVSNYILCK